MAIPPEMRYQFVTGQIKYHNEKIIESFNLFIRLFTGIVVAAVWLSTQPDPSKRHSLYAFLAFVLVVMLATMTIITVIANVMAWYGYRHAETGLVGADKVSPPTVPGSCWNEIGILVCIIASSVLFCIYNPLVQ